jgi:hypothetical protein
MSFMAALSPLTAALVKKLFPSNTLEVSRLLEEQCGENLPFCKNETPESLHRLRFAALKASEGNVETFREAVDLAKLDWRDLLVWTKFDNDLDAHEQWAKQILG